MNEDPLALLPMRPRGCLAEINKSRNGKYPVKMRAISILCVAIYTETS